MARETTALGRRGVLAMAAALGGCAQVPAGPTQPVLGPNRSGYISINAPIVARLRDLFIEDVNRLLGRGAREIHVLLTSPGGVVTVAQEMIAFIDRTHAERNVDFVMHNTRAVASAACYLFLAGQRRVASPGSAFLFHEASLVPGGALTSQALQEASVKVQEIERGFLAMLKSRTKLTDGEASSFVRRTVFSAPTRRGGMGSWTGWSPSWGRPGRRCSTSRRTGRGSRRRSGRCRAVDARSVEAQHALRMRQFGALLLRRRRQAGLVQHDDHLRHADVVAEEGSRLAGRNLSVGIAADDRMHGLAHGFVLSMVAAPRAIHAAMVAGPHPGWDGAF